MPKTLPEVNLNNVAEKVCETLEAPACVTMIVTKDGQIAMAWHGMDAQGLKNLLCEGISLAIHQPTLATVKVGGEA